MGHPALADSRRPAIIWRVIAIIVFLHAGSSVLACDLCAVASATAGTSTTNDGVDDTIGGTSSGSEPPPPLGGPHSGASSPWSTGLLTEYMHASTVKHDGETLSDPAQQRLDSVTTQVLIGYSFDQTWGARVYVPYVHRWYQRLDESGFVEEGWESGVGDILIEGTATVSRRSDPQRFAVATLFAGVELPTGDASRLDEEHHEAGGHNHGGGSVPTPTVVTTSVVHGHQLALGSGSWDVIAGASAFVRHRRFYATGHGQYALRTEGANGYRYGDGVVFGGGPGVYMLSRGTDTLGVHLNVSGMFTNSDEHDGVSVDGTAMREVYAGPDLTLALGGRLSAELGVEVPVWQQSEGTHLTGNLKAHAGMNLRW